MADELGRGLSAPPARPLAWRMARGAVSLEAPVVVGIVNVTPDSFSDGGRHTDPGGAVAHAEHLVAAGAGMLDIGGESTRPGRPTPVPVEEEWRRLGPVVRELCRRLPGVPLSVDTVKAEIARRALEAGAWAINDVSGLRLDPDLAGVCATHGAGLILMHSRGTVSTMATYEHARYDDLLADIRQELLSAVELGEAAGVAPECIALDPGLGFAKTPDQSYRALAGLAVLTGLGFPVMVGPSRKRFLAAATGRDVAHRDGATAAACLLAYLSGASLFRVHAVEPTRDALAVARAARMA